MNRLLRNVLFVLAAIALMRILVAAYNRQELFKRIAVTENESHATKTTLETWEDLRFKDVFLTAL